ncbi:MAG: SelT/SelW/SelH family protein [Nocardioides sp.]|uniref:SelT/SelW/SelH family protein n=1 Tax=Nocardioides sp. TaxID=35761 RepID=UPI0039E2E71A
MSPRVRITYCSKCRWMLRSLMYAGELLQTFEAEIGELTLVPGDPERETGIFRVDVDGQPVWNRKTDGGFPDISELKRRVRDLVAPGRSLGHGDRAAEVER